MQYGLRPDAPMYSAIIGYLCKLKQADKACSFAQTMVRAGFISDSVTFGSLIKGLKELGLLDEAEIVFKSIKEKGTPVTIVAYNTLIEMYCS